MGRTVEDRDVLALEALLGKRMVSFIPSDTDREGVARLIAREIVEDMGFRRALEPDGWISRSDVDRIRGDGWDVPKVNVWGEADEGDCPIYIGNPRPAPTEGER